MADFSSPVSAPSTADYAAPRVDFGWLSQLPDQFFGGRKLQFDDQQRQRTTELQKPIDTTDTNAVLKETLRRGGAPYAEALLPFLLQNEQLQQAMQPEPLLGGQGGGSASPQGAAPQTAPQAAVPQPRGGGDSAGSVVGLVSATMPQDSAATGQVIAKIAQTIGVDPNAPLTPGQQVRAKGLLQRYAQPQPGAPAAPPEAGARVAQGFGALSPSPAPAAPAPTAQPPGPQQPQQPLVYQEPLPAGYTDPQKAIQALEARAAQLSVNPKAAGIAKQLQEKADRIRASISPQHVSPYETIVSPTGQAIYEGPLAGPGNLPSGATLDAGAEQYYQTGKLPPNTGRGVQGARIAQSYIARAAELHPDDAVENWPSRWQQFATKAAGLRTFETRAAGLTLAENEASRLIPRVREISAKVNRTQYPSLNALILAAKKQTGGEDVIKLGIAMESLIPVYARVLKPVGQIGVADTERAHELLNKAWSNGQVNAALDQMQVELQSAKDALKDAREDYGSPAGSRKDSSSSGNTSASGAVKWERGPDGKPRPAP